MGEYGLPPNAQRWMVRRKAELIEAIGRGDLSLATARERYSLTTEELISWESAYNKHGLNGLRALQAQVYRRESGRASSTAPAI